MALGAILGLLWLLVVLGLAGFLGGGRADGRGAIAIYAEPGQAPQIEQWASALRMEDEDRSDTLAGLAHASDLEKAWLEKNFCQPNLKSSQERAARAWRIRNTSGLCGAVERRVAQAPLAISLGPVLGVGLSIVLGVALGAAALLGLLRLLRIGVAYRRLYASEHRVDRSQAAKT